MELEPYNPQKALALQILNNINLDLSVSETISKVYTFKENSLIMTGKRLICVQRANDMRKEESGEQYECWNILYSDIMWITLSMYDTVNNANMDNSEFARQSAIDNEEIKHIVFQMKILYHDTCKDSESLLFDQRRNIDRHHQSLQQNKLGGIGDQGLLELAGGLRVSERMIRGTLKEMKNMQKFYTALNARVLNAKCIR